MSPAYYNAAMSFRPPLSFPALPRERSALEAANEELRNENDGLRKALEELREDRALVIRQERSRVLRQLANGIAHEFNNALSPILGFIELLRMSQSILSDPVKANSYLTTIHSAAKAAACMVSRLREISGNREASETAAPDAHAAEVADDCAEIFQMLREAKRAADSGIFTDS